MNGQQPLMNGFECLDLWLDVALEELLDENVKRTSVPFAYCIDFTDIWHRFDYETINNKLFEYQLVMP